jgi:hypothetical protein
MNEQLGPLSEDGMWRWDGTQWQPTEANLQARAQQGEARTADEQQPPRRGETSSVSVSSGQAATLDAAPSVIEPGSAQPAEVSTRAQRRADKKAARDAKKADSKARAAMLTLARSPAGRARTAFERGDLIFQCSFDVLSQQAVIVKMVGSATTKQTTDPTETLNAVSREGWELVTGSFVFIEEGQQSRDKFMSSGQNVATKGRTMGYYLFKRNESMLAASSGSEDPLDEALDEVTEAELTAPDSV